MAIRTRHDASKTLGRRALPLSVALAITLFGCSWFDKKTEGPPVEVNKVPVNYRANMLEFLKGQLNDPVGVRDAYITEPRLQQVLADQRYVVCVRFDAKDPFGQYSGPKEHIAIYFAGNLTQFVPANPGQCTGAAYQRFPELEQIKK